jgi:hypothetical protein
MISKNPRPVIDSSLRVKLLEPEFISGDECDRLFGTTPEIRKNLRASGDWYAPVHYQHLNGRVFLYRVATIRHFLDNRHQPEVHLSYCESLLQKLQPSKTPSTVGAA